MFYRENKVVTSSRIFNCTEFGIIKMGIKQSFPFPNILNGTFQTQPLDDDMFFHLAMCNNLKYTRYREKRKGEPALYIAYVLHLTLKKGVI